MAMRHATGNHEKLKAKKKSVLSLSWSIRRSHDNATGTLQAAPTEVAATMRCNEETNQKTGPPAIRLMSGCVGALDVHQFAVYVVSRNGFKQQRNTFLSECLKTFIERLCG